MRKSSRQIASPRPRSRNHTLASSAPPAVKIRTHDMLNPQERRFLEAAEMGDRPTLAACLEQIASPRPRSRNHTLASSAPPAVKIRTHDMLNPQERRFLEAAEMGDRPTLAACLEQIIEIRRNGENHCIEKILQKNILPLNVNAVDSMGRTAIEIAVDNENNEIVELLLQQENIHIGNALLCAIREGNLCVYRTVEMLVNHPSITKDMLGDGWAHYIESTEAASNEYSSDISPVILAAHLNQFEILQMLLSKDARIEKPHKHWCVCEVCDRERNTDSLHHSLKRINTYMALASPAWMSLTRFAHF
uniref:Transient receptor ion channel domain-containing protein n=1 Tax=Ascaris lumbricoides TaxID=6252 RepID=A0A9J2Q8I2_ASCLU